ncbi:MAG: MATE family efflux transporter [Lachnospiraceae bacterium]|nr:MATE family efflux transporter [Lachnospiraceae bacterium]
MKTKTLNMTIGNPVYLLLVFAIPMLVGNLFQQMYNLADSIIVGKGVGANALAAVGATNSITFLFFALCNGIGSGGGIIAAQQFGAGNEERVKKTIVNAGYILFAGSLLVGVIAFFLAEPMLRLMDTPADIMEEAVIYMKLQCIGLPLVALYNHVSAMLRALGDSRSPLYFLIFSCFLNIVLDVWFVYGFNWGVLGAAMATIIAQLVAGIGSLIYAVNMNSYFKLEKRHFKVEKDLIWGTVRLGIPLSVQFSLVAISCMALQIVVNSYGAIVVAAFTAVGRVEQLMHQPYGTLSAALSTYCGQNLGANEMERIRQGFKKSLLIMGIFSVVMLPIMQLGSEWIIRLFVDDPQVIYYGAEALRITSWFYMFLGIINMARGILNGVGDALFALINGGVEVVIRVVLPVVMTGISFIGVWGIWWSTGLSWLISAAFCVWRYASWKRKHFKTALST